MVYKISFVISVLEQDGHQWSGRNAIFKTDLLLWSSSSRNKHFFNLLCMNINFWKNKIKNPQGYKDEVLEWNTPSVKPCNHASLNTCAWVLSPFSHVQFFAILWTVACQAPLSMAFPRQGLSWPPPGDLPDRAIEHTTPESPALQENSLLLSHRGSPTLHTKIKA